MTKLKIKVTKDILERSKNCGDDGHTVKSCAVAVAVRDIFPCSSVTYRYIRPFSSDLVIDLPKEVGGYIYKFDSTSTDERPSLPEFEFEVEISDEIIEKINIEELKPLLQNHPTLQLIEN